MTFLQVTTIPIANNSVFSVQLSFIQNPIALAILLAFLGICFTFIALLIARSFLRKKHIIPEEYQHHILQILVPKDSIKSQNQDKTDNQQGMREAISVAETFFSSIGGLKPQKGFYAWFYGRKDHITCEIVMNKGQISFYVAAPKYLLSFVEQQIQAQYPQASIEKIMDYNFFHPTGVVMGANMLFDREGFFPIKTYQDIDSDPINAITQSLAQISNTDGAAIQFVIRSAHKRWHTFGKKIASTMRQGKNLADAKKEVLGNPFLRFISNSIRENSSKDKDHNLSKSTYQLSPLEEEMIKRLETKSSKAGMDANIRVIVSAQNEAMAKAYLDNIIGSFAQYNIYEYGNSFKSQIPSKKKQAKLIEDFIFRFYSNKHRLIFNTEELASLYHFPLPTTETQNIKWLEAKRAPAPLTIPTEGLFLGVNEYRSKKTPIYIQREDRRRHMYIIGKSGSGKSVTLNNMAAQDIQNGEGVCVIDPHGDLVDDIIAQIPKERLQDVILFDPSDTEFPLGMNLLEYDQNYPEQKTFVINEMIKIFDKLYDLSSTGGPMFEQYMRNAMLLIMDDPESGSTLMEISKVLADEDFRKYKLSKTTNQTVKDFWIKQAQKAGGDAALENMVPYITSKLTQFVSNDIMRPIIGQQKSAFDFRQVMDNQKILLVKLSKGKIGELNANLLGMVIVGKILMAALSRTDMPKSERKDFYLYIDEFQNFTTDSIAVILSEARKYLLNLIIAHQYVGQLVNKGDTSIKDAVFGNVGTIMSYKIGPEDAELFAKEFAPVFNEYDVLNVEQYTAYIKLLANNQSLKPFNIKGSPPVDSDSLQKIQAIKELSRYSYGKERSIVEEEILKRANKKIEKQTEKLTKDPFESPFGDF